MTNWNERVRERRLNGNWGDIRVEQLLEPCDVEIGPDYRKLMLQSAPAPVKSTLRGRLAAFLGGAL